jgi:hypothetical protein
MMGAWLCSPPLAGLFAASLAHSTALAGIQEFGIIAASEAGWDPAFFQQN